MNYTDRRTDKVGRPRTKAIDMSGSEFMRTSFYAEKKVIQNLDRLCNDTRESRSFYLNREIKNLLKRIGYWQEEPDNE